ncbi:F-box protein pof7 [Golovinomyces cichoracearum]|uniref:F-box protein pof7 n=1 Tax=Golovinomyces cichoracearum TaxID=62708 RepID=A0A420IVU8_9PEZI|nr:F-box protein pof7 [Golovinomyces cichoracearum]
MNEPNPELEKFREKWREEVEAKLRPEISNVVIQSSSETGCLDSASLITLSNVGTPTSSQKLNKLEPHLENHSSSSYIEELIEQDSSFCPQTALEHYEQAVKRENEGNLGDSVDLYRKAFRMDDKVDREYKLKHFPPVGYHQADSNEIISPDTKVVPKSNKHVIDGTSNKVQQLIASFAEISIEPETTTSENKASYCPFSRLPDEIIIHILIFLADIDFAGFVRVAQVCKKMAFLVATEEQIWKKICLESKIGFREMCYEWSQNITNGPFCGLKSSTKSQNQEIDLLSQDKITEILLHKNYSSSWYEMFRLRPRIRYNGCYISKVNYLRPGEASLSQVSWNNPVHIVTYYRYLRFFRDGSVISLLTTNEPVDVVPFLTKDFLETSRNSRGNSQSPSKFMQNALRGRWHLAKYLGNKTGSKIGDFTGNEIISNNSFDEGNVFLETEGANEKYFYQMKLSLQSTPGKKSCKNNKLTWCYFRSINKLTNELGEFLLKAERPFYWSRVKKYGDGD